MTTFAEPASTPTALLLLGRATDLASERGVECPGGLPDPADPQLVERARVARASLAESVFVLGHHYQRDEVIQFADVTGDSFKLAGAMAFVSLGYGSALFALGSATAEDWRWLRGILK